MFIILEIIYVFVFFFSPFKEQGFFFVIMEEYGKERKYKKDIYYRFLKDFFFFNFSLHDTEATRFASSSNPTWIFVVNFLLDFVASVSWIPFPF